MTPPNKHKPNTYLANLFTIFFYQFFVAGDSPKTPVIGQRKIIVKNPDGTTKIIHQSIPANATPKTPGEPSTQKVQIIRGPDGKVSVRGLNPNQQLIQMPDGKLHVLTQSTPGQKTGTVLNRSNQKVITKVVNHQSTATSTPTSSQKVVIRQQVQKAPTMVVKSATPKVIPQRVVVSGGQILNSTPQKVQVTTNSGQKIITSKAQLLAGTPQKIAQPSNLQQILTQGTPSQKIVINQSAGNKLILSGQHTAVSQQQNVVQSPPPVQQQTQQIIVNQPQQKVVQQYVNSSNQQQQIIVGGQRIILNPGQRIITQQQPVQQQVVQQQVVQQQVVHQQMVPTVVQQQPQILQQVKKYNSFGFTNNWRAIL